MQIPIHDRRGRLKLRDILTADPARLNKAFARRGRQRIGYTQIGQSEVSTVLLPAATIGPTLTCDGEGNPVFVRHPPLPFETMVFGGRMHHARVNYLRFSAAQRGHREVVKLVRRAEGVYQMGHWLAHAQRARRGKGWK